MLTDTAAVSAKDTPDGRRRRPSPRVLHEGLAAVVTVVASALLAFAATGLRLSELRRPLTSGDLFFSYGNLVNQEQGWHIRNPDFGWPLGQDLRLFPVLDETHFGLMKVLGLFTSDPVLIGNLYYLLGFPLAGAFAHLFLRVVGVRAWLAVPFAVSYAILPWHTDRAVHLFLASYWVVPLGLTLVHLVATGRWDELLARLPVRRRRALTTAGVLAAVAVGLGGIYYALMVCFLVVLALVTRLVNARGTGARRLLRGPSQWLVGTLLGTVLVTLFLAQVGQAAATSSTDVGGSFERLPRDSEIYGGRLITLLLPWDGTPVLGRARTTYNNESPIENPMTQHGLVTVAGTWLLLGVVLWMLVVRRRQAGLPDGPGARTAAALPWLAGMHLLVVLAFTTTGFGALVAYVLPELRGWDRFSVFVALLATAGAALGAQWVVERVTARRFPGREAWVLGLTAALVAGVVVADQAQNRRELATGSDKARFQASRAAMASLDASLTPTDCPLFQYPAIPYPEAGPTGTVADYEPLLNTLAGNRRPISYGGLKGSLAGDWTALLDESDAARFAAQVAAVGFCGLEVLNGAVVTDERTALVAALPEVLGEPLTVDERNERTYFDLRGARERLLDEVGEDGLAAVAEGALRPIQIGVDRDTSLDLGDAGSEYWWLTRPSSTLSVHNPSDTRRTVTVELDLGNGLRAEDQVDEVRLGGVVTTVDAGRTPVEVTVDVPPRSTVDLPVHTTAPGVLRQYGDELFLQIYARGLRYDRGPLPAPGG